MKRFILISIALIAIFAAKAQAVTYHQSDQLQTELFVQQSDPVSFPFMVSAVPVVPEPINRFTALFVQADAEFSLLVNEYFAYLDPGRKRDWRVNMNYKITQLKEPLTPPASGINCGKLISTVRVLPPILLSSALACRYRVQRE